MSDEHHKALMRNLGGSVEHTKPGENVAKKIAATTTSDADDALLSPVQRKMRQRAQEEKALTKGKHRGAFDKLRARVQAALANGGEEMTKALPTVDAPRIPDLDQPAMMRELKSVPVADGAAMAKSTTAKIDAAKATIAKALGTDAPMGASSLEAGTDSDSATLSGGTALRKQSLDRTPQATVIGGDELLKAASDALSSGKITAAEAQHISTHVAMNGGKHCPAELVAKVMK